MKRTTFLLCLLFALCMQVVAAEHSYTQKAVKQTVKVGTSTREMLVYVPTDLPEKAPMGLPHLIIRILVESMQRDDHRSLLG